MPERRKNYRKKAACAGLLLGMLCFMPGCRTSEVIGKVTETPEPTKAETPTVTNTPSPSSSPTPQPTETPTATARPTATERPTATPTVKMTNTPTPQPTIPELPTVVPTPMPSSTPSPVPTKPVTKTPTKPPTQTSAPSPTELPDYMALIQSGWQRTEDFFGKREIYFSGMFHHAELSAAPGRYEYSYTAVSDENTRFVIAGEENAEIWQFLDTLAESAPDCQIFFEGEEDYRYEYTIGDKWVCGRIYSCPRGEEQNLMRVELSYPSESGLYGQEGYIFYLR